MYQKLRQVVYERDHGYCQICATPLAMKDCEIDHIKPKVEGGSDDLENLRTLCAPCHRIQTVDLQRRRAPIIKEQWRQRQWADAHADIDEAKEELAAFRASLALLGPNSPSLLRQAIAHAAACPGGFNDPTGLFNDVDWNCPFCAWLLEFAKS